MLIFVLRKDPQVNTSSGEEREKTIPDQMERLIHEGKIELGEESL